MYKMIVYLLVAFARSATKQSDSFSVVGPTTYLPLDLRRITEAIDAGDHDLLGLLDLSASFDTVDHDLLAERLSRTYGSARPRLIGIAPTCISVIANRRSSSMGSSQLSTLSAVASIRARCSGRCCPCSTLLTWVSLLPVSAYHPTSTLMNLSFKRGNLHQQLYSSGVEWSLVLSGYPNGCIRSNRLRLNPEKTDFLWCETRRRVFTLTPLI